jgi:PAS domain S-box-containing protein
VHERGAGSEGRPDRARLITERAVLDALPRAVVMTDPAGLIVLWNAHAERLFGWTEDEVLGRSVVDVLAPADDVNANREALASVAAGNPTSGDRAVRRRDGTLIRIATNTTPLLNGCGEVTAILGLSEDVTASRAADQRARDLTDHFGAALEAGGLGTWRWDMASGTTIWDERLEALFGLPPGGFDGTFEMYVSLLHPDDREAVLESVRHAVESTRPYRVEHRIIWPDGSVHWISGAGAVTVDERGVATGTVGCSTDITARIEQEAELHRLAEVARAAADNERVQRARLEFLVMINDALQESSSVRDIMRNVTARAVPRLGDWCTMHVLPFDGGAIPHVEIAHLDPAMVTHVHELLARFPFDPLSPTGPARVIRTGQTEFIPDITDDVMTSLDLPEDARRAVAELALTSSICVPLIKRARILGAIQFVSSSPSRRYTEDDVVLARTVAARIAASLENRRLHEQQRVIAHTLQHSLLPAAVPTIPGFEIAVRYWAAGEGVDVGGDFYDVFALKQPGRWGVVIGDVCGTGPAAAALTGLARHSIRASAWHGESPCQILESLNYAVQSSSTTSFLTAVYAELRTDGPEPTVTVACGGHPPPVQVRGDEATTIGQPGRLIGVFDDVDITEHSTPLMPGDVVAFYTDGATDVRPPHSLDTEAMVELIARAARDRSTADRVADELHDALDAVLPFPKRDDDIALLILRRTE